MQNKDAVNVIIHLYNSLCHARKWIKNLFPPFKDEGGYRQACEEAEIFLNKNKDEIGVNVDREQVVEAIRELLLALDSEGLNSCAAYKAGVKTYEQLTGSVWVE